MSTMIRFPTTGDDDWEAVKRRIKGDVTVFDPSRKPGVVYPAREAVELSDAPARDGLPSDTEAAE